MRSLTLACLLLGLAAAFWSPSGALAQQDAGEPAGARVVDVVQVVGYIDPVVADFVHGVLDTAEDQGVELVILRLDSPGALVDDSVLEDLADRIRAADVPVAVWVGESGAEARGGAVALVQAADVVGMAVGAQLGDAGEGVGEVPLELRTSTVGPERAVELGVVDLGQEAASSVRSFIINLDGLEADGRVIDTVDVEEIPDGPAQPVLNVQPRLQGLPLSSQLFHTVASPPLAYLLLAVGLTLLIFELFTAGIGIAGVTGAGCLVLASYGLAVLPTNPIGLALCVLGILAFTVDVQTGVPRLWSAVGLVAFTVGSLFLFGDGVRVGWLPLVAGIIGVALMMLAALPSTVRSRFSTPTVGREWMIGELGEATADIAPEGTVRVRDALWPARANRATPLAAGDRVRVVAIEGTVLEVEPEQGGARDYRERSTPA